jgi:anti-sigma factor RsiW
MTDSRHLSAEDVTRYLLRTLTAEDLLIADDHIHDCEDCRRRLAAAVEWSRKLSDLSEQTNGDDHLTHEQLTDFVEGRLSGPQRAAATRHIRECGVCRAEVEERRGTTQPE